MVTEGQEEAGVAAKAPEQVRRLPRAERREQILAAATRAFARGGYTATSLDDVAAEAGITRVLLYRHFDSKTDLYRAVLARARARLDDSVGANDFDYTTIPALLRAAADDPDGFRLLFRHAAREPEFREAVDTIRTASTEIADRHLAEAIPGGPWRNWAALLVPAVALEAVIAWLDAGQPNPDQAAERVTHAVEAVIQAAQPD